MKKSDIDHIIDFIQEFTFNHAEKFTTPYGFSEFLQGAIKNIACEEDKVQRENIRPIQIGHFISRDLLKPKKKKEEKQEETVDEEKKDTRTYQRRSRRGPILGVKRGPYKKAVPKQELIEEDKPLAYVDDPSKKDLKDLQEDKEGWAKKRKVGRPAGIREIIPYSETKKEEKKPDFSLEVEVCGPGVPPIKIKQNDPESILNDNGEYPEDDEDF